MSNGKPERCPVCGGTDWENYSTDVGSNRDAYGYDCPRCGQFVATRHFVISQKYDPNLDDYGSRKRADLSAWLREKSDLRARRGGNVVVLDMSFLEPSKPSDLRDSFKAAGTPSFPQKADKLLRAIDEESEYDGETICAFTNEKECLAWEARAWAQNEKEFDTILNHLREEGLVEFDPRTTETAYILNVKLTGKGLKRVEKLKTGQNHSDQGFVAMWFDYEIKSVINAHDKALAPAIKAAGYNPLKIDDKPSPERIDGQIEVEIAKSRFVVADLTGERGGVYYEAGYARGLKIPVIWTCREDDFDKRHFDIKQFHCIKWTEDNLAALESELKERIEKMIGPGPNK